MKLTEHYKFNKKEEDDADVAHSEIINGISG